MSNINDIKILEIWPALKLKEISVRDLVNAMDAGPVYAVDELLDTYTTASEVVTMSRDELLDLEGVETCELDAIESFIEWDNPSGWFESEQALSDAFDDMLKEPDNYAWREGLKDDGPAFNEAFSNWTDGLCKDGRLHELQYNNYVYVGEFE